MHTQDLIYPHGQRIRTRSMALLLALNAFAAAKLIAADAINVSRAYDFESLRVTESLQMLDVDCDTEQAVRC